MKESLIFGIVWVLLVTTIFGACAEYTLEYWLSAYKHEPVDLNFGLCVAFGLFGPIPLVGALVTKLCETMNIPENCPYIPN